MKHYWALIVLTVIISVQLRSVPPQGECPQVLMYQTAVTKDVGDGSYYRKGYYMPTADCYRDGASRQEEWTDLPEKGGRFLKVVEPEAANVQ